MAKRENDTLGKPEVQVFELTMDNEEDQDELNRQLRKAGEPPRGSASPTETSSNLSPGKPVVEKD